MGEGAFGKVWQPKKKGGEYRVFLLLQQMKIKSCWIWKSFHESIKEQKGKRGDQITRKKHTYLMDEEEECLPKIRLLHLSQA